jgi:outer membrane protein OmpA-like peptidoglycan-associated protein
MERVSSLIVPSALVFAYLLSLATSAMAQNVTISGQVIDKKGKPIPKIKIMLLRGISTITSTETDQQGNYAINYLSGRPVTVLYNGNTEWLPGVFKNVIGPTTGLNIQLTHIREKLTAAEARRTVEALNYLREVPELAGERLEYAKVIDPFLFPPELRQTVFQDNVLARLAAAEEGLSDTAAKTSEVEENARRISGQVEEFAAVSNAARGGVKAAQATADAAVAGVNATNERIAALDEYEIRADLAASVNFEPGSVSLTVETRRVLDQLAQKIVGTRGYTLTISGFANGRRGSAEAIRISQLRAEAVARYLTANYQIPLWRIRALLGYGESQTVGGERTSGPADRVEITTLLNRGVTLPSPTMNPGVTLP